MRLRRYRPADARGAWRVYFEAVHEGAAWHYGAAERRAWAPCDEPESGWNDRLAKPVTWVAEDVGRIVGFMTLGHDGHLDLAYVAPTHMGAGVALALYRAVLADPEVAHVTRLSTDASHLFRRFLERQGWRLDAEQRVERNGVHITNFRMSRTLPARPGARTPTRR